ncbi:MAG: nuclear transport factor 2 family protein [Xanthomonadales bacterium]|nr:nuclear transport factor 2 family protein [Xanthomonadales bacterium]
MAKHIESLKSLIGAWRRLDVEGVLVHLHDDFVWYNSGGLKPPLQGKANMRSTLQTMAKGIKQGKWRLFNVAEVGSTVWMEGVDEFISTDGIRVAIPYAGTLEFKDGLIFIWREFYEGRLIEQQMAGQGVSAEVEALLDRPEV